MEKQSGKIRVEYEQNIEFKEVAEHFLSLNKKIAEGEDEMAAATAPMSMPYRHYELHRGEMDSSSSDFLHTSSSSLTSSADRTREESTTASSSSLDSSSMT